MNNFKTKQIIIYTMAYGTNIMYILLMGVLGFLNESVDKEPETAILILLIGVVVSVISSTFYIRKIDIEEVHQDELIKKLAIRHLPALLGLLASVIYLYV